MKSKGKDNHQRFRVLLIITGAVLVSFVLSFLLGQSGIFRLQQLRLEYEQVQEKNFRIAQENKRLAREIRELRSDPAAVEKIAREELQMASPGDVVLLVPDEKKHAPEP